mmetsp:Transcript_3831/g.5113  ORF Transcript_3831/g.5113 Transcript_3831/m.5113 type:complete len:360 (+) Transcript_3831:249-1328(+)
MSSGWITKCPCGQNQDDEGLMIQCDRCLVWQHGNCVGIFDESKVPKNYFCEQCKPQHKIHQEARRRRSEVTQARQIRIMKGQRRARTGSDKDRSSSSLGKSKKRHRTAGKRPKTPRSTKETFDASSSRSSREQKKLERILESFRKMEDKSSRRKSSSQSDRRERRVDNKKDIGSDKKKRGRPRRVGKRKTGTRTITEEAHEAVPVGKLVALSPMYLGRKAWLMRLYRKDQLSKNMPGFEHLLEQRLPLKKRVLANYVAQQERLQEKEKIESPENDQNNDGDRVTVESSLLDSSASKKLQIARKTSQPNITQAIGQNGAVSSVKITRDTEGKNTVQLVKKSELNTNGMNERNSPMEMSTV